MILADTSIWVDYLRSGNTNLATLLETGSIFMHAMIVGELACGNLQNRTALLNLFEQLPNCKMASHDEVLHAIHQHQWHGKGIGFVDAHILTAALLYPGIKLWTLDKRLQNLAAQHQVAHGFI